MVDVTTIDTTDGALTLHVCKDGNADNTDWISIYEESFPPDQRQPLQELTAQLRDGTMELDETRDQNGRILCMTLSEIFQPRAGDVAFILACYTAVAPKMRGVGIGSVHRKKMEQLLREEYDEYLGLISEIESTKQHTDDPELAMTRVRRKNFFLRLGLIPLDVPYRFPSYERGEPLEGELLWFPFGKTDLTPDELEAVVTRIYVEGYALRADDDFVRTQRALIRESFASRANLPGPVSSSNTDATK